MEIITKENKKTILGKNTSNNSWLFAELKYNSGVSHFDERISGMSKEISKSSIEIGQYPDGITIKMTISWKSYLIAIRTNEIEKIAISKDENAFSRLRIDVADTGNIILLFKDNDKNKLVEFLKKYTNITTSFDKTVESIKNSKDESIKGNGAESEKGSGRITQIKCPHCQKLISADTIKCTCGFIFDKEEYNKSLISGQNEHLQHYQTVGGWLALFCLALIIFSPAYAIYNLIIGYSETHKYFNRYDGLEVIFYIDLILSIALMFLSIRAGVGLWRIKPNAVRTAKNYLLIFLGYSVLASFLPFMAGLPSRVNDAMIPEVVKGFAQALVFVGIWYSYLEKSKRVKGTYRADAFYSEPEISENNNENNIK